MTKRTHQAMTVDVEDYFHVSAFEQNISRQDWQKLPLRVEQNTYRLLELFDQYNARATFFTLGWVAEQCPQLIKDIVAQGHELASHGYDHQRAIMMTREQFKQDVAKSKDLLEQASGEQILGYRAPSFSIGEQNVWAYDVLAELGFEYSSSTYPIEHDLYGVPHWPRFKFRRDEGIVEIPVPTIRKNGSNIGIGGGGYFRLYPYSFSKRRIDKYLSQESAPYSFYFHPWEIDPEQPRIEGASWRSKVRHYINLSRMEGKIVKLLNDYQWSTMRAVYLEG
ncbi:XrtA system polysaccharide deacetylase [Thalassotalea montiporae]